MKNNLKIPELEIYEHYMKLMKEVIESGKSLRVNPAICEDIFQDAVVKALDKFDEKRGTFKSFTKTIYVNKLKSFVTRDMFAKMIILSGDLPEDFDLPEKIDEPIELENFADIEEFIFKLKLKLTDKERNFLNTMLEILPVVTTGIVTETSLRIGLTPSEGWNLWRKIVRKAKKLISNRAEMYADQMLLDVGEPEVYYKLSASNFEFEESILLHMTLDSPQVSIKLDKLKDLLSYLSVKQADKLIQILQKEF